MAISLHHFTLNCNRLIRNRFRHITTWLLSFSINLCTRILSRAHHTTNTFRYHRYQYDPNGFCDRAKISSSIRKPYLCGHISHSIWWRENEKTGLRLTCVNLSAARFFFHSLSVPIHYRLLKPFRTGWNLAKMCNIIRSLYLVIWSKSKESVSMFS